MCNIAEESCTPKVTVVTPSFNQGEFLEDTIRSVLDQDYPELEYIVIDGGSSDCTLDILRQYEDRISWVSEPDRGQAHAIAKGWSIASGSIITWLNSDDLLLSGAVTAAVEELHKHPNASLVYGDAVLINRRGEDYLTRRPPRGTLARLLWSGNFIPQPASFLRAEAVRQAGGIDPDLQYCMDYDLFIRLAKAGTLVYVPRPLAAMRIYMGTKSSHNTIENWQEKLAVLQRYRKTWLLSWLYLRYLIHRLWSLLPTRWQDQLRRLRGLPRDRMMLESSPGE